MSEITHVELEMLKAKAAAFDAIKANQNLAENLRQTNELLKKQEEFRREVSSYLRDRQDDDHKAEDLVQKYLTD